jgi:hypothetical protein
VNGVDVMLVPRKQEVCAIGLRSCRPTPTLCPQDQASQVKMDPAASVMSVIDDLGGTVDDLSDALAKGLADSELELDPGAAEEGMQSIAYAAKRVMSQIHIIVQDVQVWLDLGRSDCWNATSAPSCSKDPTRRAGKGRRPVGQARFVL